MTWNASSAACPSRKMRRQTPSTIVPCRAISTSNAAPDASPDARNRSSSCASLRLPSVPSRKSTSSGRADATVESLAISSNPRSLALPLSAPGMRRLYTLPASAGRFPWPTRFTRTPTLPASAGARWISG